MSVKVPAEQWFLVIPLLLEGVCDFDILVDAASFLSICFEAMFGERMH